MQIYVQTLQKIETMVDQPSEFNAAYRTELAIENRS